MPVQQIPVSENEQANCTLIHHISITNQIHSDNFAFNFYKIDALERADHVISTLTLN